MRLGRIMTHVEFEIVIRIYSLLIKRLDRKRLIRVRIEMDREEDTNAPKKEIIIHIGIPPSGVILLGCPQSHFYLKSDSNLDQDGF